MKIAVTGASGHVGNNLCRILIDLGHQVKALIHKETRGLTDLPLEQIRGDVTVESDLVNLCSGCEVVFHLAARISLRRADPLCEKTNVDPCRNLVKAASSTGVKKIIHFSSIHAFQENPLGTELNETWPLSNGSQVSYDRSKAMGQKIMMESSTPKLEIVVLNPTAIIGPNDFKPSFLGSALVRFYRGEIPAMIPGGYNWVDVRDVCKAAIRAIEYGSPGECYLLGGNWLSMQGLATEIQRLGGQKAPGLVIPVWMAALGIPIINLQSKITGKEPLYTSVSLHTLSNSHKNISCAKAKNALGFNPRPFHETLSDTIAWFRDNRCL